MERKIQVIGNTATRYNTEYIRNLLNHFGIRGNFEVSYKQVDSAPPGRAVITITGPVNYSEVDDALCHDGFKIIGAETKRDSPLERTVGGAQ